VTDAFHHPESEEELAELVKTAHREGRRLRVRGAAHSVSHAIYTAAPGRNRVGVQEPPDSSDYDVMLDRLAGWEVVDEAGKLVRAEAGIHLGKDPSDPTGRATEDASLLKQLADRGWTLFDTGGITHQTISGFTATGSSGGSLQNTSNLNLHGFRFVDGLGEVHEVTRGDDGFDAMMPSLGLLGVVSAVTLECTDLFAISGSEDVTTVAGGPVDLLGDGDAQRPSLERFLREAEFARLEWWPQRGADRLLTWQARRMPTPDGFVPRPYRRFQGGDPEVSEQAIAVLFAILGNLDDLGRAREKLEDNFDALRVVLARLPLGDVLADALEGGVDAVIAVLEPFAGLIREKLPEFFPELLKAFVGVGRQEFTDWGWSGLPMDNQADDVVLPTEFTEAWVPLVRTQEVMRLIDRHFREPRNAREAYRRTGTFAWELYSAMPASFWLSPAYSSGADEWAEGALRVDPYWCVDNAADPATTFFPGLWNLLRDNGVPFRLHWGKFQPVYRRGDRDWVDFFRAQYPRWDDFLALRAERDPGGVFLTDYWRDRFGLWEG
jgi:D-arabinono-1,4-lactone oxidase